MNELQEKNVEVNNAVESDFDFASLTPMNSRGTNSRGSGREGALAITNARTGQRITISKAILEYLGNPKKIQFLCGEGMIVIAQEFSKDNEHYLVKYNDIKGVVYSKGLVNEVTMYHNLDFSNKTSQTFYNAKYTYNEEMPVVIVSIQ